MKNSLVFNLFLLFCILSGCAVAPTTPVSERSERRADKRAEAIQTRIAGQVESVPASDSSEKRVENIRARRGNVQRPVPAAGERGAAQKPSAADDINPAQTSEDPSFGYSKENPVKLGSDSPAKSVASSYVYLRQLRDKNRMPFKFARIGSVGANDEGHIIDLYKLTDSEGGESRVFVDMYHPDKNPLDCMAPKGMFIAQ